jgi:hypothetical protein
MKFSHKFALWMIMGLALGTFVFGVLQFIGPPPQDPPAGESAPATNRTELP